MKLIKKAEVFNILIVITIQILVGAVPNNLALRANSAHYNQQNPIKVGVMFYRFDDPFVSLVRQGLENIQNQNEEIIKFTFYDSKNDKNLQNETLNKLLETGDINLLILSLVDLKNDPREIIEKVKEKNVPVIFVSKRTVKIDPKVIASYDKAYYVVPDSEQAGRLQGKILADLWHKNKELIDTNKDNIMQYIMLKGEDNNIETINRTKHSILAIEDDGIKVEKLAERVCNWREDSAREATEALFIQFANKIEVIISNNDEMAIGAIQALQKYRYNTGNKTKNIPVVGINAIPEVKDFIKKGYMSGTIYQDANAMAEALFEVGLHLVDSKISFNCTEKYHCDETGRIILMPFYEYRDKA